jgi:hypothetical protein
LPHILKPSVAQERSKTNFGLTQEMAQKSTKKVTILFGFGEQSEPPKKYTDDVIVIVMLLLLLCHGYCYDS